MASNRIYLFMGLAFLLCGSVSLLTQRSGQWWCDISGERAILFGVFSTVAGLSIIYLSIRAKPPEDKGSGHK
jgi:hypothetical protein